MIKATNLGFPRIGPNRELKKAIEGYWAGSMSQADLLTATRKLREERWRLQQDMGLQHIPSNDFSLYDHVLDVCVMFDALPRRFDFSSGTMDLESYFQFARGRTGRDGKEASIAPMEMTKWFDTNYHYIVPEFEPDQTFRLGSLKAVDEFTEAQNLGITTRPVLLGPVSFLMLGKMQGSVGRDTNLSLLDNLLPAYTDLLRKLNNAGAEWVQIDEPMLVMDISDAQRNAYRRAFVSLSKASDLKLLLATYFGGLGKNLETAASLPVDALHIDLVRAPDQLDEVCSTLPVSMILSAGVVDGRNVWRNDLDTSLGKLRHAMESIGPDRLWVAPSCSLLHTPVDLERETDINDEVRSWLAFAKQKLREVTSLSTALNNGENAVEEIARASRDAVASRRASRTVHRSEVKERVAAIRKEDTQRHSSYAQRREAQAKELRLPLFPTTTIGSFPQTSGIRRQRAAYRRGEIDESQYVQFVKAEIQHVVREQERIGLDVLVHGEPERTDMVEYFGQKLTGLAFTRNGWVQSYGTRCVRPPIIYGDVSRPTPMTVEWSVYAQSLTDRPMKGMLTGPITILQWSFVRNDQPRMQTARQIALAIRDEVADLEAAGICIIQIDEPALREGMPLRHSEWAVYLDWAVDCFKLSSCCVADRTQIHTHMCYAEFNDIIEAIAQLDADVISIEASRSKMELLEAFTNFEYPAGIGPGVYDIHSPRVPSVKEIADLIQRAQKQFRKNQLWINPDCGLKTRHWNEMRPALENMVHAAELVRSESESF